MRYRNIKLPNKQHGEEGIALIITLSILAIILLIAIGFALSSRIELKSSSSYSDVVSAESLAKMGMDRCIVEIANQPGHQPLSGDTNDFNYSAGDLTQIDGSYTNDFLGTRYIGRRGDFINLDALPQRGFNEPYWIVVSNRTGQIIGRFAYMASGALADINAIGNIFGPGDTFVRGSSSLLSDGYVGIATTATNAPPSVFCTNIFTRGICSDVNLAAFLRQLGYTSWDQKAQRILYYRYGWPGGAATPAIGSYKPGVLGIDDNADGVIDNPQEYDPVQPDGCPPQNQAIDSLDELDDLVKQIAPDNAHTNLGDYATTYSSDPNLTNAYGIARLNINEMTGATNVQDVANMLSTALLGPPQIPMDTVQVALNLIDFHTTNLYPTVYQPAGSAKVYVGVKPTPYLNQILDIGTVMVTNQIVAGVPPTVLAQIWFGATTGVELWNPYGPLSFPDPCHESLSNSFVVSWTGGSWSNNAAVLATFPNPAPGFPFQQYQTPAFQAISPWIDVTSLSELDVAVTNVLSWSDFYGLDPTNLINPIAGSAVTNAILSFAIGGPTQIKTVVINREADDPRMNILYNQPNDSPLGSGNYLLGQFNTNTCSPSLPNPFTGVADSGPREGLGSFYVKTNDYVTIGEIGYVDRGEPWQTIRLQPNQNNTSQQPYGDGNILDYIRVNDLSEIRGRININADTNGPLGVLESPLLYALFEGLTNSPPNLYLPLNDANYGGKIQNIIREMGDRRALHGDFTGIGQICGMNELTTRDFSEAAIPTTSDAERESIIRRISNLITTRTDSGVTDVVAWGQVIKGKPGHYTPGAIVQIRAKYDIDKTGHLIRITKFQYTRQ